MGKEPVVLSDCKNKQNHQRGGKPSPELGGFARKILGMRKQDREMRRMAGVLAKGLSTLRLNEIPDPRSKNKIKRSLSTMLTSIILGMMTRQHSLKDVEEQTEFLSLAIRGKLFIPDRIPDTTIRSVIMRLSIKDLRNLLYKQTKAELRSKRLKPSVLPIGVCAVDGKYSTTRNPDDCWAQKRNENYQLRTMTCSLVSSEIPLIIDTVPVPSETNEMGVFEEVVNALYEAYGKSQMIQMISTDAGMSSLKNANTVIGLGFDYLFALKDDQPTLKQEAKWLVGPETGKKSFAYTIDRIDSNTVELREIWTSKSPKTSLIWDHIDAFIRVRRTLKKNGKVVSQEDRYFCSSMSLERMNSKEWLKLIRSHWRIENEVHGVLDQFYDEDDHPWLYSTEGQLAITLLRRVSLNILLVSRHLKLMKRGSHVKCSWKRIIRILNALAYGALDFHLDGLRWWQDKSYRYG